MSKFKKFFFILFSSLAVLNVNNNIKNFNMNVNNKIEQQNVSVKVLDSDKEGFVRKIELDGISDLSKIDNLKIYSEKDGFEGETLDDFAVLISNFEDSQIIKKEKEKLVVYFNPIFRIGHSNSSHFMYSNIEADDVVKFIVKLCYKNGESIVLNAIDEVEQNKPLGVRCTTSISGDENRKKFLEFSCIGDNFNSNKHNIVPSKRRDFNISNIFISYLDPVSGEFKTLENLNKTLKDESTKEYEFKVHYPFFNDEKRADEIKLKVDVVDEKGCYVYRFFDTLKSLKMDLAAKLDYKMEDNDDINMVDSDGKVFVKKLRIFNVSREQLNWIRIWPIGCSMSGASSMIDISENDRECKFNCDGKVVSNGNEINVFFTPYLDEKGSNNHNKLKNCEFDKFGCLFFFNHDPLTSKDDKDIPQGLSATISNVGLKKPENLNKYDIKVEPIKDEIGLNVLKVSGIPENIEQIGCNEVEGRLRGISSDDLYNKNGKNDDSSILNKGVKRRSLLRYKVFCSRQEDGCFYIPYQENVNDNLYDVEAATLFFTDKDNFHFWVYRWLSK